MNRNLVVMLLLCTACARSLHWGPNQKGVKSTAWHVRLDVSPVVVERDTPERLTWQVITPDAAFRVTLTRRSEVHPEDLFAWKANLKGVRPITVLGAQGEVVDLSARIDVRKDPKHDFNAPADLSTEDERTVYVSYARVPVGAHCLLFLEVSTRDGEELAPTRDRLLANLKSSAGEPYAPAICR